MTENTKDRDEMVANILADIVLLVGSARSANPKEAAVFDALQTLVSQLMLTLLGATWPEKNNNLVQAKINERVELLSKRVADA